MSINPLRVIDGGEDLPSHSTMKTELSTPAHWASWISGYTEWQRASHRPITTIKLRSYHLRRFAHFVRVAPDAVTLDHIVRYMGQPGWSAGYARSHRSTLRSFFLWAHKHAGLPTNPAEDAPPVVVVQGKARPAPDAAITAIASSTDSRVRLMGRFGNELGMRCCEIAVVHRDDIRGERGLRSLLVHGKGNKERLLPISDELAQQVLSHEGYVFPGQINGHLSADYVSKLLSRAMGDTGTGHRLRHRAGTRWLRTSGGNLRVAQELLGHASVATTQIYTHVDDDELRMAVMAA